MPHFPFARRDEETLSPVVPYEATSAPYAPTPMPRPVLPSARLLALLLGAVSLSASHVLAAQQPPKAPVAKGQQSGKTPPRDTLTAAERESVRQSRRDAQAIVRRRQDGDSTARSVRTEAAATTAFGSPEARAILERAREARIRQDSTLTAYRATTTQRFSVGLGVRRVGMEKLLFRGDNVAKIAWKRGVGVWVTPIGSRMTVPMASKVDGDMVDAVSIPYFPGRESLWFPSSNFGVAKADIDERDMIHPIARGAEAYYRYVTGDSIDIKLDGGRVIKLRELRVTARTPSWRTFVGSFWFDRDGGQLVRAAYRLAVDIDMWDVASEAIERDALESKDIATVRDSLARANLPRETYVKDSTQRARRAASGSSDDDEPPAWVKATLRPAKAKLDAISVEYGLYAGKFWLPRQHSATASAQMGFLRVPVQIDEKFTYEEVNGDFSLAALPARPVPRDSTRRDSSAVREASQGSVAVSIGGDAKQDSSARGRGDSTWVNGRSAAQRAQCAKDSLYTRIETRYEGALRVAYEMPCDSKKLSTSAALPPAYSTDDELFDVKSRDELLSALDLSLQPGFAPQMPKLHTGADLWRYNRIEGLSLGVSATQSLGAGYTLSALARIGHVDRHLNGEFSAARSNGARTVTATVFHRLNAMNPDWAGALTLGPSLPALINGRDEGFYYRSFGAELGEKREMRRGSLEYRLFMERSYTAGDSDVVNTFSFARVFGGDKRFLLNVPSERASIAGVSASFLRAFGADPRRLRLTTATRVEAGTGTFDYARASLEGTATRIVGRFATALTGSLGSSAGRVPAQRRWYVGGLRTVRGQIPGTQDGNAFWLSRAEIGTKTPWFRPVGFFDVGWAGNRDAIGKTQPQRGAGFGFGFLDGLFRLDIARGLYPSKRWRADLYFEAPI